MALGGISSLLPKSKQLQREATAEQCMCVCVCGGATTPSGTSGPERDYCVEKLIGSRKPPQLEGLSSHVSRRRQTVALGVMREEAPAEHTEACVWTWLCHNSEQCGTLQKHGL